MFYDPMIAKLVTYGPWVQTEIEMYKRYINVYIHIYVNAVGLPGLCPHDRSPSASRHLRSVRLWGLYTFGAFGPVLSGPSVLFLGYTHTFSSTHVFHPPFQARPARWPCNTHTLKYTHIHTHDTYIYTHTYTHMTHTHTRFPPSPGPTREVALQHMHEALDSYVIKGLSHNLCFLKALVSAQGEEQKALFGGPVFVFFKF